MKKLILLILLIPTLCFALTGETSGPTTTNKDSSGSPFAPMTPNEKVMDGILKDYGIVVCHSSKPITYSSQNFSRCYYWKDRNFKTDIITLYRYGWKLVQILKTNKGYLYYLDKVKSQ